MVVCVWKDINTFCSEVRKVIQDVVPTYQQIIRELYHTVELCTGCYTCHRVTDRSPPVQLHHSEHSTVQIS